MKHLAFFLIVATFFIGCKSVESQQATNVNINTDTNSSETLQSSKNPLEDLTPEQKQQLDRRIPPNIREILDKADEITISYNVDKDTMRLKVLMFETVPNADAKVSDPALKKQFLNSFYSDASSNSNGSACFSPRHRVKAQYKTKIVEMDICYECDNFRGKSSSGNFGGGLVYKSSSKSSAVMDAIIERYGTKIK